VLKIMTTVLLTLISASPPPTNSLPLERATVKRVITSNTVVVAVAQDPDLWVTLLGVGTPETPDAKKEAYLLGKLDLDWLRNWLPPGTPVLMERREESATGRPLVFLYRIEDKFCWNAFLVKSGAAFATNQAEFPEYDEFVAMESVAKKEGVGLWTGYLAWRLASTPAPQESPAHSVQVPLTSKPLARKPTRRTESFSATDSTPQVTTRIPRYVRQEPSWFSPWSWSFGYWPSYGFGNGPWNGYTVHVNGYLRQNGTYVHEYYRRPPGTARW
jgi:endonuclease YncB( thermonuclease family)